MAAAVPTMLFRAHSAAAAPRRYDLKAKKDFFKEAKLAGAIADVKYVLTHAIEKGVTGVTLMSKQVGHNLKAVGDTSSYLTTLQSSPFPNCSTRSSRQCATKMASQLPRHGSTSSRPSTQMAPASS